MSAKATFKITAIQPLPGHMFGRRQRLLRIDASVSNGAKDAALMTGLYQRLRPQMPPCPVADLDFSALNSHPGLASLEIFAALLAGMQENGGAPALETPVLEASISALQEASKATLYVPTSIPLLAEQAARWLIGLVEAYGKPEQRAKLDAADDEQIQRLLEKASKQIDSGVSFNANARRMVRAAHQEDMPYLSLPGRVLQLGYGGGARLFRGSVSDVSPSIGLALARDKRAANHFLKVSGFPVPEQHQISSLKQAEAMARKMGYPVVIKAGDLDGGKGVYSNIMDGKGLEAAYLGASALTSLVLIEKHISGHDARVTVINGEIDGIFPRRPAQVVGDGRSSIRELIAVLNSDPLRGRQVYHPLAAVEIDKVLLEFIARSGFTPDSVPDAGQTVVLRGNANLSTGGIRTVYEGELHPEIKATCIRAAALFGIDICGVDLLCDDLTRPLSEQGGVICEVNGGPQIGLTGSQHVNRKLFESYLPRGFSKVGLWLADEPCHFKPKPKKNPLQALQEANPLTNLYDRHYAWPLTYHWQDNFLEEGLPTDRLQALAIPVESNDFGRIERQLGFVAAFMRGPVLIEDQHPLAEKIVALCHSLQAADGQPLVCKRLDDDRDLRKTFAKHLPSPISP